MWKWLVFIFSQTYWRYAAHSTHEQPNNTVSLQCGTSNISTHCVTQLFFTDVRLRGGRSSWEGRVEVLDGNQTWNTICNNEWDDMDALVVCHQLQYDGMKFAQSYPLYDIQA